MNTIEQMERFVEPRSIAIIGVPRRTGEDAFNILENLLNYGFSGRLYPVNPLIDRILGIKAYSSVKEIPEVVDLAVIATPRPPVLDIVKECTEKGIKAMVIVAQGFADGDEEGKALQAEIMRIAKAAGARILGPNSLGVANAFNNLNTSFVMSNMEKIPVGIICQSGIFFPGLHRLIPVGKAIDLANASDIDFSDGLEYFENDPDIRVILLHIEGIGNGKRFVDVASRVTKRKPIIALKSGKSAHGAKAVQSHTGSLSGRTEAYDASFRQCGIIQVGDIEELGDLAKSFLRLPLMKGKKLGVVSITGAGGVLTSDACQKYGLEMAELEPTTLAKIRELFPPWLHVDNPVDFWPAFQLSGHPYREVIKRLLELVAADHGVDGIVFVSGVFANKELWDPSEDIIEVAHAFESKPIACWLYGPFPEIADKLEGYGKTVVFPTYDRAVRALARLREYAEFLEREP